MSQRCSCSNRPRTIFTLLYELVVLVVVEQHKKDACNQITALLCPLTASQSRDLACREFLIEFMTFCSCWWCLHTVGSVNTTANTRRYSFLYNVKNLVFSSKWKCFYYWHVDTWCRWLNWKKMCMWQSIKYVHFWTQYSNTKYSLNFTVFLVFFS